MGTSPYLFHPLDPRQYYVGRANIRKHKAKGFESLAYKVFGSDVISSIAFAIDPMRNFRDPRGRTGYTRERTLPKFPIPRSSNVSRRTKTTLLPYFPTQKTLVYTSSSEHPRTSGPMTPRKHSIRDTTAKTRNFWEDGGPLEFFKPTLTYQNFPPSYQAHVYSYGAGSSASLTESAYSADQHGPFAFLSEDAQQDLYDAEVSLADQAIQDNVNSLLSGSLPSSPTFDLVLSIAELRDIHRFADLSEIPRKLRDRTFNAKDLAGAELAREFGLKPLLRDILTLMELPDKISKRLNYLITRNGKETTYRQRKILNLPVGQTPPWSVGGTTPTGWALITNESKSTREAEVRSAVKARFEFPKVLLPQYRRRLYARHIGLTPSIATLYNITPWSWLIDWFTGLGDYLQVMENIISDEALINDGWMTYQSKVVHRNRSVVSKNYTNSWIYPVGQSVYTNHESRGAYYTEFEYEFQKRIHMGEIGVKTITGLSNLTGYQLKILSALFAQRN